MRSIIQSINILLIIVTRAKDLSIYKNFEIAVCTISIFPDVGYSFNEHKIPNSNSCGGGRGILKRENKEFQWKLAILFLLIFLVYYCSFKNVLKLEQK